MILILLYVVKFGGGEWTAYPLKFTPLITYLDPWLKKGYDPMCIKTFVVTLPIVSYYWQIMLQSYAASLLNLGMAGRWLRCFKIIKG